MRAELVSPDLYAKPPLFTRREPNWVFVPRDGQHFLPPFFFFMPHQKKTPAAGDARGRVEQGGNTITRRNAPG
jgi:hypothetical protein